MKELAPERRRRLVFRGLPALGGLAAAAFAAGAFAGSLAPSQAELVARDFSDAWERSDFAEMHGLLDRDAQAAHPLAVFRRAYRRAAAVATINSLVVGEPSGAGDGAAAVPVDLRTSTFGLLRRTLVVPVRDERVRWTPSMAFPGLPEGTALARRVRAPERAALLARDGQVLAEGPADGRSSPLGALAASIAGTLEPEDSETERAVLYRRGFSPDQPVGASGLERAFENRLAGRPGGELVAGGRVIAASEPRKAAPVRTTIDPELQETAVSALAGRLGGIAALDPRTGEIRALAGIAFSAPQPPGSTFKIVTATAALEARAVKPSTQFPVETAALVDGVELENANGESCGGTFRSSFAHSCNSVFVPLGVKIGSDRIVNAALRYGWNAPPSVDGEAPSTLPPANEIVTPVEIGSTAIGQGRVLATPLRMASVAQTIASDGVRLEPSLAAGVPPETSRVTSRRVARVLRRLMVDVVDYGTGIAAAIEGVRVAGKTGTAELEDTRGPNAVDDALPSELNTNAWFTSFAPAARPRIAVAVMLVRGGAGGETAAPAARQVLEAALAPRR